MDNSDLLNTLKWIIERIESEADKQLEGNRANWKQAAIESVNEAYGAISRHNVNMGINND